MYNEIHWKTKRKFIFFIIILQFIHFSGKISRADIKLYTTRANCSKVTTSEMVSRISSIHILSSISFIAALLIHTPSRLPFVLHARSPNFEKPLVLQKEVYLTQYLLSCPLIIKSNFSRRWWDTNGGIYSPMLLLSQRQKHFIQTSCLI